MSLLITSTLDHHSSLSFTCSAHAFTPLIHCLLDGCRLSTTCFASLSTHTPLNTWHTTTTTIIHTSLCSPSLIHMRSASSLARRLLLCPRSFWHSYQYHLVAAPVLVVFCSPVRSALLTFLLHPYRYHSVSVPSNLPLRFHLRCDCPPAFCTLRGAFSSHISRLAYPHLDN